MYIQSDVELTAYSTMRLGGRAAHLVEISTKEELVQALKWAEQQKLPILVIGGGSNIIFRNDYPGLLIVDHLKGFDILQETEQGVVIRIAAGEPWDLVVAKTVDMGLSGIEKLSAIPGTAGATPVQNVGAYGAEIADTFVELEAYDMHTKRFVTLSKADCQFTYRHSIFKSLAERQYIITSITLQLSKLAPKPPFYETLQRYLNEHAIHEYSPRTIREAVVAIRRVRLPDPAVIANTGSFFKNPIVDQATFAPIEKAFPNAPHWPQSNGIKLAAGWLIEQAGLRGYRDHGMKVYEQNALVLINEHATSYADLAHFRETIVQTVQQKFGIALEQEPELM